MMPVYRMGTATVLAIALLLSTVPAGIWTHLAGVARAQDEQADADTALPGQVIAHGIARLPRGEVAWTVRSIEVPGGEGTPVASFPIGFATPPAPRSRCWMRRARC